MEEFKEEPLMSAAGDFKALKGNLVWQDIAGRLLEWKEGYTGEVLGLTQWIANSNPSTAAVLARLGDLTSRVKMIDLFLALPDVLADEVLLNQEQGGQHAVDRRTDD